MKRRWLALAVEINKARFISKADACNFLISGRPGEWT